MPSCKTSLRKSGPCNRHCYVKCWKDLQLHETLCLNETNDCFSEKRSFTAPSEGLVIIAGELRYRSCRVLQSFRETPSHSACAGSSRFNSASFSRGGSLVINQTVRYLCKKKRFRRPTGNSIQQRASLVNNTPVDRKKGRSLKARHDALRLN